MRVECDGGGRREDLGAVDEGAGVVADDGEHAHDELEVALELDLVVYGTGWQGSLRCQGEAVLTDEGLPLAGGSRVTGKL